MAHIRRTLMLLGLGLLAACQTEPPGPEMPRIVMASPENISKVHCPIGDQRCFGSRAVYDHRTATIYLPTDWRADNDYDLSTLLHEFAHHVQHLAGDQHGCLGDAEKEAYTVQLEWLRARGHEDPMQEIGMTPMAYMIATSCRQALNEPVRASGAHEGG